MLQYEYTTVANVIKNKNIFIDEVPGVSEEKFEVVPQAGTEVVFKLFGAEFTQHVTGEALTADDVEDVLTDIFNQHFRTNLPVRIPYTPTREAAVVVSQEVATKLVLWNEMVVQQKLTKELLAAKGIISLETLNKYFRVVSLQGTGSLDYVQVAAALGVSLGVSIKWRDVDKRMPFEGM